MRPAVYPSALIDRMLVAAISAVAFALPCVAQEELTRPTSETIPVGRYHETTLYALELFQSLGYSFPGLEHVRLEPLSGPEAGKAHNHLGPAGRFGIHVNSHDMNMRGGPGTIFHEFWHLFQISEEGRVEGHDAVADRMNRYAYEDSPYELEAYLMGAVLGRMVLDDRRLEGSWNYEALAAAFREERERLNRFWAGRPQAAVPLRRLEEFQRRADRLAMRQKLQGRSTRGFWGSLGYRYQQGFRDLLAVPSLVFSGRGHVAWQSGWSLGALLFTGSIALRIAFAAHPVGWIAFGAYLALQPLLWSLADRHLDAHFRELQAQEDFVRDWEKRRGATGTHTSGALMLSPEVRTSIVEVVENAARAVGR